MYIVRETCANETINEFVEYYDAVHTRNHCERCDRKNGIYYTNYVIETAEANDYE